MQVRRAGSAPRGMHVHAQESEHCKSAESACTISRQEAWQTQGVHGAESA